MRLAIGTLNPAKIEAVKEIIRDYPLLSKGEIQAFGVSSGVSEQPLSLEEMIMGAKNRARSAFLSWPECKYSFGIESGLFQAIGTNTGFLEGSICAIYDGERFSLGLSSAFEVPQKILSNALHDKIDLGQAAKNAGITDNAKLGNAEGLIGILSNYRMTRIVYTKQAILTALIQIENPKWYP